MAKTNVYLSDFIALLNRLAELEYLGLAYSQMMDRWVRRDEEILQERAGKKRSAGIPRLFATASTLSFRGFEEGELFSYGVTRKEDEEILRIAEEAACRTYGHFLCLAYEAMESFVTRLLGDLLFHLRAAGSLSLPKRDAFDKTGDHRKNRNTPEYFQDYSRFICKQNSNEAFGLLRKHLPAFAEVVATNKYQIDLVDFYKGIAACRHQIVHHGGEVTLAFDRKLTKVQREYCEGIIRPSALGGVDTLLPNKQFMVRTLEHLAAFAFLIFKAAAERCAMRIELPPEMKSH